MRKFLLLTVIWVLFSLVGLTVVGLGMLHFNTSGGALANPPHFIMPLFLYWRLILYVAIVLFWLHAAKAIWAFQRESKLITGATR